jgi:hypothetical protein
MMQGFPISAQLPEDPGFGDRFWYWRGHSGSAYIHSIYDKDCCPPLNDAVFVLVSTADGRRTALGVGRFGRVRDGEIPAADIPGWSLADEIHVHLLARDPQSATRVQQDLADALFDVPSPPPAAAVPFGPRQLALALS